MHPVSRITLTAGLLAALMAVPNARAFIAEPETLVYGRILNRRNPNAEQLVTSGQLLWTIHKPDGSTILLSAAADAIGGGFSYCLHIPHQAMMMGQQASALTVPLGTAPAIASFATITLDGGPAAILPPATSSIDLDQLLRAAALRVDLEINVAAMDSDGDGMPDWWEDLHGLDKQNPNDALTDLNGNGRNNLAEFLAGTDPQLVSGLPQLLTSEVIAYPGATSIIVLETADSDSTPAQLVYTLRSVPEGGSLLLRNAAAKPLQTDRELAVGATFTQADVLAGRLVFTHDTAETPGSFDVGVRDENPNHAEATGTILIRLFQPVTGMVAANAPEALRLAAGQLAQDHLHLIADLGGTASKHRLSAPSAGLTATAYQTYVTSFGADLPHFLFGGPADDVLTGGYGNDTLYGDGGNDTLTGGPGADTFVFTSTDDGMDVITDFNPAEGDVIDLSAVLKGTSKLLSDYVRITRSGNDALIGVCAAGTNTGFTDLVIRLLNSSLQPSDLPGLYYANHLATGSIGLPPRLGIAATVAMASENGPTDGVFTITREGTATDLSVNLLISGNATNGVDYENVPTSVCIPAGQTQVGIVIHPYVDALVELNEVVHIELAASPNYLLASNKSAEITIEDLKPQIRMEVLEGLASVADATPAAMLMRRSGLTSSQVVVKFTLSGTAGNGTDYNFVTPYVTLAADVTERVLEFQPKPAVNFGTAEGKIVRLTVKPDSAYAIPAPTASVTIVPSMLNYDAWLAANPLATSVSNSDKLSRYGFSVDPQRPTASETLARLPKTSLENGYLVLRFRRKPGITDLQYGVEYSNDLRQWSGGPDLIEDITSQVSPNDVGAAVFRAIHPMSRDAAAYMRVRLTLPDPNP